MTGPAQTFLNASGELTAECLAHLLEDGMYAESNQMYALNGFVYGNTPLPPVRREAAGGCVPSCLAGALHFGQRLASYCWLLTLTDV